MENEIEKKGDIYDEVLGIINQLWPIDEYFCMIYEKKPNVVFHNIVRRMNPVPFDLKKVLDLYYQELKVSLNHNPRNRA